MTDCVFEGNITRGVSVILSALDQTSAPVSVLIDRATVSHHMGESRQLPSAVFMTSARNGVTGKIEVRDSLLNVEPASSAIGSFNNDANGVEMHFTRNTVWNWGNAAQSYEPIVVSSGLQQAFGGLIFDDLVFVTDQPPLLLRAHREAQYDPDGTATLTNVHGTITVVNPHGVDVDTGENPPVDYDLTVRTAAADNRAKVKVTAQSSSVSGGDDAQLVFTRAGGDASTPLAIAYDVSGSARERYDYGGLSRVAVIPARATRVTVPIRTFARRQADDPRFREIVVAVEPGHRYEALPKSVARIAITD
ncbi:hypothetical protein [Phytoactinopolyspora limicola]|uniref:hypothetical protein n=1 Tax=Phytoactinopolyspora limicola TaxID=2715536 RepID=UPI00140C877D|nr:hypothetical protein [Phytoactinopolyspora limicola]